MHVTVHILYTVAMNLLESLIGLFTPHSCTACGIEGTLLCEDCRSAIPLAAAGCIFCRSDLDGRHACRHCSAASGIHNLWVMTDYEGLGRQLVYALKFGGAREAAGVLADFLYTVLPSTNHISIVTHIPTTNQRKRQRGFDHSLLIARKLARRLGVEHKQLIVRHGKSRQVGSVRSIRLLQLQNTFEVRRAPLLHDVPILLVDDVATTGASLLEAARALRSAGYDNVSAVVFARTKGKNTTHKD